LLYSYKISNTDTRGAFPPDFYFLQLLAALSEKLVKLEVSVFAFFLAFSPRFFPPEAALSEKLVKLEVSERNAARRSELSAFVLVKAMHFCTRKASQVSSACCAGERAQRGAALGARAGAHAEHRKGFAPPPGATSFSGFTGAKVHCFY
jgi:hypothetical protein